MSNSSTPGGLLMPTTKAMPAGNPRDSAIATMNQSNSIQASANKALAGGKRSKSGGAIAVPQFQMSYTPTSGNGTDPNAQIQANSQISTQAYADRQFDAAATIKKGGTKPQLKSKKRNGGNPDWTWGCFSGGLKRSRGRRTYKKANKSRTYKKANKSKSHKKTRK
jgi:hypothetical protein